MILILKSAWLQDLLSNEISKNTTDIFNKVVLDSSEKLQSDFERKINDFDSKVDRQITRMNQSILSEKTDIVKAVNDLKTDFSAQKI